MLETELTPNEKPQINHSQDLILSRCHGYNFNFIFIQYESNNKTTHSGK